MFADGFQGLVRGTDVEANVWRSAFDDGWFCLLTHKGNFLAAKEIPDHDGQGSILQFTPEQVARVAYLLWQHNL